MSDLIEVQQQENTQVMHSQQQDQYFNLISNAVSKGMDIESLEKIMTLKDKHDKNQERKAFYQALSSFQSQVPVVKKRGSAKFATKNGGETSYTFAKLEHIVSDIKPFLLANNLSFRFEQSTNQDKAIKITCIITHSEGHSESNSMVAFPDQSGGKNVIQQSASTVTYLQRYTLTGALGVVVEDEDSDGEKDHLAISNDLTTYIKDKNSQGLSAKAVIVDLEKQWQVSPLVKEHVVETVLESRMAQIEATLAVNKNAQSITIASDGYSSEIMDTCRAASVAPNKYLDKIRQLTNQALQQAN